MLAAIGSFTSANVSPATEGFLHTESEVDDSPCCDHDIAMQPLVEVSDTRSGGTEFPRPSGALQAMLSEKETA